MRIVAFKRAGLIHPVTKYAIKSGTIAADQGPSEGLLEINLN